MSTSTNTSASKPLILVLVVVVLLGLAYFVYSKSQAATASEDNIPGVLRAPSDYKAMTPEQLKKFGGPTPAR